MKMHLCHLLLPRQLIRVTLVKLLSVVCFSFSLLSCRAVDDDQMEGHRTASLSIDVVLVKIGGSSITNKSEKEALDEEGLEWFAKSLGDIVAPAFKAPSAQKFASNSLSRRPTTFVVIHGAGSFGHFQAKEFGLRGPTTSKSDGQDETDAVCDEQSLQDKHRKILNDNTSHRYQMQGLAETRRSVQQLNHHVVSNLITHGSINAVGISPCFGIPSMRADANNETGALAWLETALWDTIQAGLIPVLHGDACLYHPESSSSNDGSPAAAILSGDILMEVLGQHASWVTRTVFITDVDGVFNKDPRILGEEEELPQLLREIAVDRQTGNIILDMDIEASSSSHTHDVTGGLKTKLKSATSIVQHSGRNVTIVKCGSSSATQALRGGGVGGGDGKNLNEAVKSSSSSDDDDKDSLIGTDFVGTVIHPSSLL